VVITLTDGTTVEDEIAVADAHPLGARPFTRADYIRKFRTLAEPVLLPDEIDRFLTLAQRLPELTPADVMQLTIVAKPGILASAPAPKGLF
jgi:2-methylcitrate dehydratase